MRPVRPCWSFFYHTATHCYTLLHTGPAIRYNTLCGHFDSAGLLFTTLQRTATHSTHCNTLQHTTTHYNTLQHTGPTLHYNTLCDHFLPFTTLQHTATRCNALQRAATHCNTLQHTVSALRYDTQCDQIHSGVLLIRVNNG